MDKDTHTFSVYVQRKTSRTEYRKWWEFWKEDQFLEWQEWVRVSFPLTDSESKWLQDAIMNNSAAYRVLLKALSAGGGDALHGMQLELTNPHPTQYIPTTKG